jgi:glycosyltransferase involved in cell wall biosynthesis
LKVLFLTSYIYDIGIPEFTKNKTGFGLMVKNIVEHLSFTNEAYLITRVITKEKQHNGYNILSHTWLDIFHSFSWKYCLKGIKYAFIFNQGLKERLRYIYYYLDAGYIKRVIKNIHPDIVHIHGIGYRTKSYIDLCEELNIHYLVTLHGLIGLDESASAPRQDKEFEKEFLIKSEKLNISVTVISSRIKERIISNYGLSCGDNIRVITNGTDIIAPKTKISLDVRAKYNIPAHHKIILCVGNISERKNQTQIVDAYNLLNRELKENCTVLFLGEDMQRNFLGNRIKQLGLEKNLIKCGFVERVELSSYWSCSDLNIVASLNEGFGLSMIEGFVWGIPTVTFSDLDAIKDLYNEKAMFLVEKRSDEALALGIEKALLAKWEKEAIINHSKEFSLEKMARKYEFAYRVINREKVNVH